MWKQIISIIIISIVSLTVSFNEKCEGLTYTVILGLLLVLPGVKAKALHAWEELGCSDHF